MIGRRSLQKGLVFSGLLGLAATVASLQAQTDTSRSTRLRTVCRADSVRMVFVCVRGSTPGQYGFPGTGANVNLKLLRWDATTGVEDTIGTQLKNYEKPLINRDGTKIVYTSFPTLTGGEGSVYVVDWANPEQHKKIARGASLCLWYDSSAQKEYVVFADRATFKDKTPVKRVNIADSTDVQLVWQQSSSDIVPAWFGVSSDLKYIGAVFGWPNVTLRVLSGPTNYLPVATTAGCWASMPYDTTGRLVCFTTDHRALKVVHPTGQVDTVAMGDYFNQFRLASYSRTIACFTTGGSSNVSGGITVARWSENFQYIDARTNYTSILPDQPSPCQAMADLWVSKTAYPPISTKHRDLSTHPWSQHRNQAGEVFDLRGVRQPTSAVESGRFTRPGVYLIPGPTQGSRKALRVIR